MILIKKTIKNASIALGISLFSSVVLSADLGSYTANCDAASAPWIATPISGQIGDTFTVTTAGVSQCWPSGSSNRSYTLTNGYANNYQGFVASGTVITVTLTADNDAVYVARIDTNAGRRFDITIAPPAPPAPIPTMSEWAMIFMASLMAMIAIRRMRRR